MSNDRDRFDNRADDFTVGDRVELHPGTDLAARGARYGEVVRISRGVVAVRVDKLPSRRFLLSPDRLAKL